VAYRASTPTSDPHREVTRVLSCCGLLWVRLVEIQEQRLDRLDFIGGERRGHTSTLVGPVIYTIGGRKRRPDSPYNSEVSSDVSIVLL
jgi:hypothetical protein